jgi:hypothetical protein
MIGSRVRQVVLTVALSAFAGFFFSPASADAGAPPVEPVTVSKIVQSHGSATSTTTIRINVASGGCTQAGDFRVVVTQRAGDQVLHFDRLKQDVCERDDPQGSIVEVTTTALVAGKPITVDNPLFVGRA